MFYVLFCTYIQIHVHPLCEIHRDTLIFVFRCIFKLYMCWAMLVAIHVTCSKHACSDEHEHIYTPQVAATIRTHMLLEFVPSEVYIPICVYIYVHDHAVCVHTRHHGPQGFSQPLRSLLPSGSQQLSHSEEHLAIKPQLAYIATAHLQNLVQRLVLPIRI